MRLEEIPARTKIGKLGSHVTENETKIDIQKLSNGKTVGIDAITAEAIKINADWLTPTLKQLLNTFGDKNATGGGSGELRPSFARKTKPAASTTTDQ